MNISKTIKHIKYAAIDIFLLMKNFFGIEETVFKLRSGDLFKIRNIDRLGRGILKDEDFESVTRDTLLSFIQEGMTVLDIGAYIGYYTILIARKIGKNGIVVAFEPNPIILKELKYNIKINHLNNVLIKPVALSDCNGEAIFYIPQIGKEAHASLNPNITFQVDKLFKIKTEKLDDVLEKLGLKKVDVIKIDAEGAEKSIFNGSFKLLSSDYKPIILFECTEIFCKAFGHNVYDVLSYVVSYGYSVEQLAEGHMWVAKPKKW
jgi:FkbM family methyltransferase